MKKDGDGVEGAHAEESQEAIFDIADVSPVIDIPGYPADADVAPACINTEQGDEPAEAEDRAAEKQSGEKQEKQHHANAGDAEGGFEEVVAKQVGFAVEEAGAAEVAEVIVEEGVGF